MDLGTLVSIGILGAFLYWVVWGDWLKPLLFPPPPAKSVKRLSDKPIPRMRSRGSRGSKSVNPVNARSAQQNEETPSVNVQPERSRVQPEPPESSPPAAPTGAAPALTLTEKELTQLRAAISLRNQGQTKQEAVESAFNCKKGGSEAWKRASTLFDIAFQEEA